MLAVLKKEFKSYFSSPIGDIFIGIFLAMCSVFFYLDVVAYGNTNFEYMFYSVTTILTFIVPVLTMRMFAEERKSGTEQILFTSPRSITAIVFGKFFAATLVLLVAELFTFIYFAILMYFGEPHIQTALATLGGFLLLSMAYISFGMFASSITENQIVAGILTAGVFVFLWFMPNFNSDLFGFSPINVFASEFPSGLISPEAVTLLVSFSILFIILTILVLQRRKSVK